VIKVKKPTYYAMLILTLSGPALAQEGPSYDDTVSFIRDKIETKIHSFEVDKKTCGISISSKDQLQSEIFSFSLADVDPSEIRTNRSSITINIINYNDRIRRDWQISSSACRSDEKCSGTDYTGSIFLTALNKNPDNSERLGRAFEHLVRICGGREQLF